MTSVPSDQHVSGGGGRVRRRQGICMTLDPNFQFLEVAFPYVARRLLTDNDPALRLRLLQVSQNAVQKPCFYELVSMLKNWNQKM